MALKLLRLLTAALVVLLVFPASGVEAEPAAPQVLGLNLTKTVGLDPNSCATTDAISVDAGTSVTYCYLVTNTGTENLFTHDLRDSELGSILSNFLFSLAPSASAFLTQTAILTDTVTNSATWTARNSSGQPTSDSDTATVNMVVPSLVLTKTVGLDPNTCATTTQLSLDAPAPVTYCYQVVNTGPIALTEHNLIDDQLGPILTSFSYSLIPSASVFLTQTVPVTDTVTNTAEWSATTPGGLPASASASATVQLVRRQYLPPIWKGSPP
jgi:hypothetical protein